MKTVQKLEVIAGVATLITMLLFIFFEDIPSLTKTVEYSNGYPWVQAFFVLVFPCLLIAISSYFHALKNSYIGLAVIIILGGIITFLHVVTYLIGSVFESNVLIGRSPGFFAFATIILALYNSIRTYPNEKSL
jgi:hypothetical protein